MAKCTFNGATKLIIVNVGETSISIKTDVYSDWKEWVLAGNFGFSQALRTIGGDPIGVGQYAGDSYFLMNGWQIYVDHPVEFDGVIYHDDNISPFVIAATGSVRSTVSSLVQTVATGGSDLTPILTDLNKIKKMIADTQAFVLGS